MTKKSKIEEQKQADIEALRASCKKYGRDFETHLSGMLATKYPPSLSALQVKALTSLGLAHYRMIDPAVDRDYEWVQPSMLYMKPNTFLALVSRKLATRRGVRGLCGTYEYKISVGGLVIFHDRPECQEKLLKLCQDMKETKGIDVGEKIKACVADMKSRLFEPAPQSSPVEEK